MVLDLESKCLCYLWATILLAWCYFEYQLLIVNAHTAFTSGEKLSRLLHLLMILVFHIGSLCTMARDIASR